jgi:hypothetical protein
MDECCRPAAQAMLARCCCPAHQDALYVLVRHAAVGYYLYQLLLREELEL